MVIVINRLAIYLQYLCLFVWRGRGI